MTNTRLAYLYRDTSNYKQCGAFTFAGQAAPERIRRFLLSLPTRASGNPSFVPAQVGLPDLSQDMPGHYDDDHGWHEVTAITATLATPDTAETFEAFLTRAQAITIGGLWDDDPRCPGWREWRWWR